MLTVSIALNVVLTIPYIILGLVAYKIKKAKEPPLKVEEKPTITADYLDEIFTEEEEN